MKIILLSLVIAVQFTGQASHASAMSDEKSRCFSKELIADRFFRMKTDVLRFLTDYEKLDDAAKLHLGKRGLSKLVGMMEDFSKESQIPLPNELMADAHRLLKDIESENVEDAVVRFATRRGLPKLVTTMDNLIIQAEGRYPVCNFSRPNSMYEPVAVPHNSNPLNEPRTAR